MKTFLAIIILALVLRFCLAFLVSHPDVAVYYMPWTAALAKGGFEGFYKISFDPSGTSNYPPLSIYCLWLGREIYELIYNLSWWVNAHLPIFPSNFIFFLESTTAKAGFLKIPAILSDLAIGIVLFLFLRQRVSQRKALLGMVIFLFNPAVWYNSAVWGQIDSLVAMFAFSAFAFLLTDRPLLANLSFSLALLSKQQALLLLPFYLFLLIKKFGPRKILNFFLLLFIASFFLIFPFEPQNHIIWFSQFYLNNIEGTLHYTVANAFNLWALLFGFDNRPDSIIFAGLSLRVWGAVLTIFCWTLIFLQVDKKSPPLKMMLAAGLLTFSAFLFLTRVHERYFFLSLPFLVATSVGSRFLMALYILASLLHLLNLYHFWWVPRLDYLVRILENQISVDFLIILNFAIFILYSFKLTKMDNHR